MWKEISFLSQLNEKKITNVSLIPFQVFFLFYFLPSFVIAALPFISTSEVILAKSKNFKLLRLTCFFNKLVPIIFSVSHATTKIYVHNSYWKECLTFAFVGRILLSTVAFTTFQSEYIYPSTPSLSPP